MTAGCHADRLLSPPQFILSLLKACQDPAVGPGELKQLVLRDSGLCARVMTAAARSCPTRIDPAAPLTSALTALDRPVLNNLALKAAQTILSRPLDLEQFRFLRNLHSCSQATADLCSTVAGALGYPAPEEARLTGLLLNLGILTLFSAHPDRYPRELGPCPGGAKALAEERERFATDHLQLAAAMVGGWHLDSFMAEALRLLGLDPAACRDAPQLVRIARLTRDLYEVPPETAAAGDFPTVQLLALDRDNLTAVVRRVTGSRPKSAVGSGDAGWVDADVSRRELTTLVFALAEREGIRAQLAACRNQGDLLAAARALLLQSVPAKEVFFFLPTADRGGFAGHPAPGQPRRLEALVTSREGQNLLAETLRSGRSCHSFTDGDASAAVFDQQLAALCGSAGIGVLPLRAGRQLVAAVVFGLDSGADVEALERPGLASLGHEVAARLAAPSAPSAAPEPTAGGDPLVRKIVHEIRTPLAVINNYMSGLRLLLEGNKDAGVVGLVETEVRRIGDILAYYSEKRADAGTDNDSTQSPAELARAAIDSLAATHFLPRQLELKTDFDQQVEPLPVNAVAVRQILVNLLKNAAEALPTGGQILLSIREYLTSGGARQVVIVVQDNGPGIGEEILAHLFSPVASTKGEGHLGLGLHIVKELADDIGARVACQSVPGQGTRFELRIPRPDAG